MFLFLSKYCLNLGYFSVYKYVDQCFSVGYNGDEEYKSGEKWKFVLKTYVYW